MPSVASQSLMSAQRGILSGTHRGGNMANTDVALLTITGISIGTDPSAYRTVIVVSQSDTTITGLFVNATAIPPSQVIYNTTNNRAIGWVAVPNGTTCSIASSNPFTGSYRHLYAYTIIDGLRQLHDYKEGSSETLGLPGGESYIVGIGGGTSVNPTWTNLTTRQSLVSSVTSTYSEAGSDFVTSGSSRKISISNGTFLIASFK